MERRTQRLIHPILDRRALVHGVTAGTATLALGSRADAAIPWLAIGKFVTATAISWGIEKILDYFWNGPDSPKAASITPYIGNDPHPATTPWESAQNLEARFALNPRNQTLIQARRPGEEDYGILPPGLVRAMDQLELEEASPAAALHCWGPPKGSPAAASMDLASSGGGSLSGIWWGFSPEGRDRYVVIRTWGAGASARAAFIPCLGDYALKASRVITEARVDLAGPRLRRLIDTPHLHHYVSADDAPC
jgi:hypothetical protein